MKTFLCCLLCLNVVLVGCSDNDTPGSHAGRSGTITAIESAEILPNPAYSNNRLQVKFGGKAAVESSGYRFQWKRDGEAIEGATDATLAPEFFTKGDVISAEIRPLSGGDEHFETAPLRIENSPPKIIAASTMMGVRSKPEIYVNVTAVDVDDDQLHYSYRWFRNGHAIDNQTGDWLDPSAVDRGDEVYAEVTASDGQSESIVVKSDPVHVDNHAPRIRSKPVPPEVNATSFTYRVVAEDVDDDRLVFELLESPAGMTIDEDGLISWEYPSQEQRAGVHTVKVRVSDPNGGAATQEFNLRFGVQASGQ